MDQVVYQGWTQRQLDEAFRLVQNKEHWKYPIAHEFDINEVTIADLNKIAAAIIFFTGGEATIARVGTKVRVTAPGYYVSVGS
jgi:hypothetical protein